MKKKILALFLSMAMILSLAACGGDGQKSTSSTGSTTSSADSSASSGAETDDTSTGEDPVQAAIDARTEPVTLNVYAGVGAQDAMAEVSAAMSDITREKLNIEVSLQFIDYSAYKQNLTLALAGGEQVDLFTNGDTYAATVSNGYALNMDENGLLDTYGSGIKEAVGEKFLNAMRVNGDVYGVTSMRDIAKGQFGLAVAAQYLDGIHYEYTDDNVIYVEADEFDNILAKIHEAYPEKNLMASASLIQNLQYDQLGGDNFGVLLDPVNSLTVEDFFSSDLYYNYCKMFYDWNQAGYISQDALTSDTGTGAQVSAGTLTSYLCGTKPGIKAQESRSCGQEMVVFQAGEDYMSASFVANFTWCIGYTTADEVASMQLLNELYTNPELSRLLVWGREGEEWVETEDGHLTFPEGIDSQSSAYYHGAGYAMPNQFIAGVWEGNDLDVWEEMDKFNNGALTSKALGFSFDNSSVLNEYTAMVNVYNEYQKPLEMGFLNPDEAIPEMVQRLKDSGLDKYIAEKQSQLDAWAEQNGMA